MDLLCTENIMHDPETEILTKHHLQHTTNQQHHEEQQHKHQYTYATETATTKATAATSAQPTPRNSPTNSNNSTSNTPLNANHTNNYYNNNSKTNNNNNVTNNNANNHRCSITETSSNNSNSKTSANVHDSTITTADRNATHYMFENQPQTATATNLQYQQQHNVYTTNLINRSLDFVNTATLDPTFLTDRCLENALKAEEKRPQPVCTYFKTIQKDITPPMRKIVAEWMMELCAEVKCQGEVVLLAISYMDRFLLTKSVRKTHLQILASACLLLASKLREPSCRALSAELLVFYTDNSIYKSDLIKWELFVLSRLGWDLSTVTPLDFLELLLIRLPIRSKECPDLDIDKVRQHAQAFISLAAKEHHFSKYSASTIAASSIAAALSGLNWDLRTGHNLRYLLNRLTDLTSVDQEYLHACMIKMETIFEEHSRNLQPYLVSVDGQHQQLLQQQQQQQQHQHNSNKQQQQQQQSHMQHSNCGVNSLNPNNNNHNHNNIAAAAAAGMLPDLTQTCKMQANSQKDIQDIKF